MVPHRRRAAQHIQPRPRRCEEVAGVPREVGREGSAGSGAHQGPGRPRCARAHGKLEPAQQLLLVQREAALWHNAWHGAAHATLHHAHGTASVQLASATRLDVTLQSCAQGVL